MQRIEITITPDGESTVEAVGVVGGGCTKLTESIERAIGKTTADVKKPEYLASQPMGQGANQRV